MKQLFFIFLLVCLTTLSAETLLLELSSGNYEIEVAEDYETLRADYIEMTRAYIEESNGYEDLKTAFDKYQDVTDELIASKDTVIKEQGDLIIIKDKIIVELKKPTVISFIPTAYYEFSASGSSGGAGLGILLFDAAFVQAQVGYPLEARIGIGWKF